MILTTKEILERLKQLREEQALRQEALARYLGIDRTTYVRKERGDIPITTDEWLKISRAMDKDPSYFFSFRGNIIENSTPCPEDLLLKLYRSLKKKEQDDFVCGVHLMLKHIRRKTVRDTLECLRKAHGMKDLV